MRPCSEFHLFSHGADRVHASAVFDLNGGYWFMKRLVLTILVVLSLAVAASGQTFRGTILGTVSDPSGAAGAGASVTVKNQDTGILRSPQTTPDGDDRVPQLPPGTSPSTIDTPRRHTPH